MLLLGVCADIYLSAPNIFFKVSCIISFDKSTVVFKYFAGCLSTCSLSHPKHKAL
jgi:hypothetical protein